MKYVVIHIPTGKFLCHGGTKKNGDIFCIFDSGRSNKPTPKMVDNFRTTVTKKYYEGESRYKKYLDMSDFQIEELFIRRPHKFESPNDANTLLLKSKSMSSIGKFRGIVEEELVLFDIMEVSDD